MTILKRTFYILLIVISGLLYFLYAVSVSSAVVQIHPSASWEEVLGKLPSSSSSHSNDDKIKDSPNEKPSTTLKISSKMEAKDTVHKQSSDNNKIKDSPDEKASKTQKISLKTKDIDITEGIVTRNMYDPGFILPSVRLCPDFGSKLQVVIIIATTPKNTALRTAVRQTWGHYNQRSDVAIGFIVGRTLDKVEEAIRQENKIYNDIIQAKFTDSYNNLTLKSVSMLEWVDHYCNKAKFIFKTDDNMFINVPKLLSFISKHSNDKRKIFGRLCRKWKPNRNKSSKYYTSVKQYNDTYLPDFTTGGGYLITSDVIHEIHVTALDKTFFKLEDVYTTGIVAEERKIQRVNAQEFLNQRAELNPCNLQKYISIHKIKTYEQYDLWKMLLDGQLKCLS